MSGPAAGGALAGARIVLVGAGGIGAPAALALGEAGAGQLVVADDDRVELSNLHRQILFTDEDVGRPKLDAFAAALGARFPRLAVELFRGRALPETALALVTGAAVVIDATDNFASRFLLADACALAGVAVVHAAAVRWQATVMAVGAARRPCYRCLFEDLPQGDAPDCATAGVVGPVCGVAGALAADAAIRLLSGDLSVAGRVVTYDGRRDRLRAVAVRARPGCPLCGERPSFTTLAPERYEAPASCAPPPCAPPPPPGARPASPGEAAASPPAPREDRPHVDPR